MASQNIKYDFKSDALNSAPIIEPPVYSDVVIDEVFGEITHDGLNYRGLGWASAAVLMAKAQIGTGVLAMPYILQTCGAVGVQNRPAAAPQTGVWDKDIHAFVSTSFVDAINAVSTAVFAFCGTPA
ncbi:MAG: hypothetical protein CYPHOPRED_004524, partial [Cyphobasidiales sp. Tagirdzhanova-0007]